MIELRTFWRASTNHVAVEGGQGVRSFQRISSTLPLVNSRNFIFAAAPVCDSPTAVPLRKRERLYLYVLGTREAKLEDRPLYWTRGTLERC